MPLVFITAILFLYSCVANAQVQPPVNSCPSLQTQCGQSCVDLQTNSANCGKCGSACKPGTICSLGTCRPSPKCKSGQTSCGVRCVNLNKDVLNCGACGHSCATGEKCARAKCQDVNTKNPNTTSQPSNNPPFNCPAGQEWCEGRCVQTIDLISDSANCGRCGNRCVVSETCRGGLCVCGPGYTSCMGTCVSDISFSSDSSNCGGCGNHCSVGQSCLGGTCTRTTPCPPNDPTCH